MHIHIHMHKKNLFTHTLKAPRPVCKLTRDGIAVVLVLKAPPRHRQACEGARQLMG